MASPLTVWSSTADGMVQRNNADYQTARNTTGQTAYTVNTSDGVGQTWTGSAYIVQEGFWDFDTSSIGTENSVTVATFSLYGSLNVSDTDFTYQVRLRDWGGTLTTADWVAGTNLDDYTLVASYESSSGWPTNAYTAFTSDAAFLTSIVKTGTTYLMGNSNRQLDPGTQPTGEERLYAYRADDATGGGGTDRDPKLYVEYGAAGTFSGIRVTKHLG